MGDRKTPRAATGRRRFAPGAGCRLCRQLARISGPSGRASGADLRRHRHLSGELLIIPDAHRHGDAAPELWGRGVFCVHRHLRQAEIWLPATQPYNPLILSGRLLEIKIPISYQYQLILSGGLLEIKIPISQYQLSF